MYNPVVLRREMVEVGRLMYERGLIAAAEGNLSQRPRRPRFSGHSIRCRQG